MSRASSLLRLAHRALRTERGEQAGGSVLRRAASAADRATGGAHADRIERARAAAERGLRRL